MPRFQRKSRRGGKRKQNVDWVVERDAYENVGPPFSFPTTAGVVSVFSINLMRNVAMVSDLNNLEDLPVYNRGRPQLDVTIVRIKGSITYGLNPVAEWWPNANGWCTANFRIGIKEYDRPNPTALINGGYNLGGSEDADESFMWEHKETWASLASWGEIQMEGKSQPTTIDVDIRTKRRCEPEQCPFLFVQWGPPAATGAAVGTWPALRANVNLRCLVEWKRGV